VYSHAARGGYPRSPNPDGWDVRHYLARTPELFAAARERLGAEVSLMHDVHSRLTPKQAIALARALEPYRLSFRRPLPRRQVPLRPLGRRRPPPRRLPRTPVT
jgi:L-alanine-DL-glutamate epimerase-like enolase superfamily enzyme